MNNCLHCGTATPNAKYCSRSCANRVNGHLFPSRKRLTRLCKHCGAKLQTRRTTCDSCNPGFVDWQRVPLQQLRAKALQQYAAQIRSLARLAYRKSSRPKACAVCGYDTHYEVCHIKPINGFAPTDSVANVNALDNLVALCPNHHWEFDHGLLSAIALTAAEAEGVGHEH
ncbi:HNH endonuclease signature motif containing protein [Hymenobacter armeniacus]|uniref:HNH endonuclease n=1 Tax=Hymenobacter armeniacus TaxID=2771358 RepID=A0ABR8JYR9_9BACT|nr:HNH endonuclease signature motif containing protein [Hymenobacter armeniacus]MBD2724572.1 HNH endonuclease [Hymenobacter armeniacus]